MKEFKKGYSMLLFWIVFVFTIYNCFNETTYISNLISASVVPLFVVNLLNFIEHIVKGAIDYLREQELKPEMDFLEAKVTCDIYDRINFETESMKQLVESWNVAKEERAEKVVKYDLAIIKIQKLFNVYFAFYTIANVFLAISLIMAQSREWQIMQSKINGITIAFFAFSILLLESAYADFLSEKFAKFIYKQILNQAQKEIEQQ